jgi:hypothetical protein
MSKRSFIFRVFDTGMHTNAKIHLNVTMKREYRSSARRVVRGGDDLFPGMVFDAILAIFVPNTQTDIATVV